MKYLFIKIGYMIPLICSLIVQIQGNNAHIQVDPNTHTITISHLFFDQEVAHILDRLAHEEPGYADIVYCYEAIKQKNGCIDAQRTVKALMAVTAYLEQNIKAPRPTPEIDGSIVGPLLECDVFRILALLQILENAIINCCNQLQIDFNGTFTELMAIRDSFTTCCAAIEQDLAGTFTTLTDIFNTLTTCCATSIASATTLEAIIINDFNGTFSTIADIKDTLTTCCNAIEINFQGTFTALASAQITCTPAVCNPISISSGITITNPGSYCLTQDIAGAIIIAVDDVVLDLNDHTLSGAGAGSGSAITINPGISNVVIKNGRLVDWDFGITGTDVNAPLFENIAIDTCAIDGINMFNGTQIKLSLITVSSIGDIGLHFLGTFTDCQLQNVTVSHAQQGIIFNVLVNGLLQNCNVLNCLQTAVIVEFTAGIGVLSGGTNIQFENCVVRNYQSQLATSTAGFLIFNCLNVIYRNCIATDIIAGTSGFFIFCSGFATDPNVTTNSTNVQYENCIATLIFGNSQVVGFNTHARIATFKNCKAELVLVSVPSGSTNGSGFAISNGIYIFINCEGYGCTNSGFDFTNGEAVIQNSQAAYNDVGFTLGGNSVVTECVAFRNVTAGFSNTATTAVTFRCFATQNGTDYLLTPLNVQNANTQVDTTAPGLTGPFAGPNLFI